MVKFWALSVGVWIPIIDYEMDLIFTERDNLPLSIIIEKLVLVLFGISTSMYYILDFINKRIRSLSQISPTDSQRFLNETLLTILVLVYAYNRYFGVYEDVEITENETGVKGAMVLVCLAIYYYYIRDRLL